MRPGEERGATFAPDVPMGDTCFGRSKAAPRPGPPGTWASTALTPPTSVPKLLPMFPSTRLQQSKALQRLLAGLQKDSAVRRWLEVRSPTGLDAPCHAAATSPARRRAAGALFHRCTVSREASWGPGKVCNAARWSSQMKPGQTQGDVAGSRECMTHIGAARLN